MIFDVTTVIVLDVTNYTNTRWQQSINVVCVLTAPPTSPSPISLPLLGPPCSLRHNHVEIRPTNNPTMASKRSSERKSRMSLTLNQKLEMLKLSEEGVWKADRLKARPLAPNSQVVKAKERS